MKNLKKLIVMSVLSLSICFVMLLGTTYAWMTDSVQSGKNVIQAGNLDAELYHTNAKVTDAEVTTDTELFVDSTGNQVKWEPGVFVYETFTVKNAGDLDMLYNLKLETVANTYNAKNLSKVLRANVVEAVPTEITPELTEDSQLLKYFTIYTEAQALAKDGEKPVTVVIFWPKGEADKDYNIAPVEGEDSPLKVELKASLVACQQTEDGNPTLGAHTITPVTSLNGKAEFTDNIIAADYDGLSEHIAVTNFAGISYNKSVKISNVAFDGGAKFTPTAVPDGGLTLTFENCTFEAGANGHCLDIDTCISDTDGTEVQNITIVLKNCRFIGDNFATADAGTNADGLYINCGAGKFTGNVTIDRCTFEGIRDNAIDLGKFAGEVSVTNCNFISWGVNSTQTGAAIKGEALTGGDLSANNLAFMLSKTEKIKYVEILASGDKAFVITRTNSSPIDMMNITSQPVQSQ